jgi:RHS repeat-associated protein
VGGSAAGRLAAKSSGSGQATFLFAGSQIIGEYDANANITYRYIPGPGTDETALIYDGPGTATPWWLHADQQGSTVAWSNGSGASLGSQAYDPYGQPSFWGPPRIAYTGQIMLGDAQLYHYKARAYDPALGRFLQPDPAGYASDVNSYAYAGGNPVNVTDPTGMADDPGGPPVLPECQAGSGTAPTSSPCQITISFSSGGVGLGPGLLVSGPGRYATSPGGAGFGMNGGRSITLQPQSKYCTSSGYATARNFVSANAPAASLIANSLQTGTGDILGLAGFESGWGTGPLIAAGTNNYFSLKAGPAFATGATGTYTLGANTFETYSSFQASGNAFAASYFGDRVTGITDPVAFAQAMNAGGKFNSENLGTPYNKTLANSINIANGILGCP